MSCYLTVLYKLSKRDIVRNESIENPDFIILFTIATRSFFSESSNVISTLGKKSLCLTAIFEISENLATALRDR